MNYNEAIDYIHGTYKFGSKLGLENISYLLELMGNPQDKLKYIHVAGTNGKGSTCAYIASILNTTGYKTGLYISPYLKKFTERISIDGSEIPEERLADITFFVKQKVDIMVSEGKNHPTEFEIVTAIGFQYFFEEKCDFVVQEVGLGGRFDATNIIKKPLVAVITSISLDHQQYLGDTLEKIAYEKAGIIKDGCKVVIYPQVKEVSSVLKSICSNLKVDCYHLEKTDTTILENKIDNIRFNYKDLQNVDIELVGSHQAYNASVAIQVVKLISKEYQISEENIRSGLKKTIWQGRFQIISKKPYVIIDGAHNEDGAKALYNGLEEYFPNKQIIFVIGVLKDKPYDEILQILLKKAKEVITITPPGNSRALDASLLSKVADRYCNNVIIGDTIEKALEYVKNHSNTEDIVCICGSLSFLGYIDY